MRADDSPPSTPTAGSVRKPRWVLCVRPHVSVGGDWAKERAKTQVYEVAVLFGGIASSVLMSLRRPLSAFNFPQCDIKGNAGVRRKLAKVTPPGARIGSRVCLIPEHLKPHTG